MVRCVPFLLAFAFPLSAYADPIETLLEAARAGNFAAVAEQIDSETDRTTQRDIVWALAATDPEIVDFTIAWVLAENNNPIALTVRAWSIYWAGGQIRGDRISRHTSPQLLEESQRMYQEALSLAKRATRLAPRFLPASDAAILIGLRAGDGQAALDELDRIMAVDPNRHSLVLTAGAITPAWGGSLDFMQALCDHYAESVADVPDYDPEICMAQAILRGKIEGNPKDWATTVVGLQADKPFLEREVMQLAREDLLPPPAADLLSARLKSEGRMSAYLILTMRNDLLESPGLPKDFVDALENDIASARLAATRDPGNVQAVLALESVFELETKFIAKQVVRKADTTDAEREAVTLQVAEAEEKHAAELDRYARRLLQLTPRDAKVLQFASEHVLAPYPDPLESDRWALSLLTNATVYSNYQEQQLGRVLQEAGTRYSLMLERMGSGDAPNVGEGQLEDVYLCPYIRAVRLADELCAHHPTGEEYCVLEAFRGYPSDSKLKSSLYGTIAEKGACALEREAPIESLLYDIVDLKPLP